MKTKTDLIPFDLEKALAGDPVVTRSGIIASQITQFNINSTTETKSIYVVVDGELYAFYDNGRYYKNISYSCNLDLFMKPKTRIINGFEVPAPETKALKNDMRYYLPRLDADELYNATTWSVGGGDEVDNRILSRNILFLTKEAAIANAKAMLGIDPYGDE